MQTLWILPALLCCMRYKNDAGCLPIQKTAEMVKGSHPTENIVSFVSMLSPGTRSELKLFGVRAIKAWNKIDIGATLYVS